MIVDSSVLIIFAKLNKLNLLLNLYKEISITEGIFIECVKQGFDIDANDAKIISKFIDEEKIKVVKLNNLDLEKAGKLREIYSQIGIGESEAIILALKQTKKILILDDIIARKIAKLHNLKTIGTLRIILEGFKKKIIKENEVRQIIKEMIENQFRLSADIINEFWEIFEKLKKGK